MKKTVTICMLTFGALCGCAGVPIRWTAETSRVQPHVLEAWRGDTIDLECTLVSYGRRVAPGAATASFMWQTNGMGSAWWQTNATVSADGVIAATWSPEMDPGGAEVAFFMPVTTGDGSSYRAAGRIRFRPSPGAGSRTVELPQPGGTLDFGDYQLINAPWATLAAANEAIAAAVTSATGALVIPPAVDLGPYATTVYVAGAITSATGALVIPPPPDLTPYATTGGVAIALQSLGNSLSSDILAASNAAMPRAEMGAYATTQAVADAILNIQVPSLAGYATESYVADYFATNYTPPDLAGYATTSYADAAASNAQAAAVAQIPSLAGYATESYVAEFFATNYTPPDLAGYATTTYADAAASNAQASAIAAIPSLAGYATESYVADFFATNYTPPDLSGYATTAYADAAASNAQAAAVAQIPSLAGYATESYVADFFATNYTPPDLAGYATTAYADAAASNAQVTAIAAIPSLAGYATEAYVADYFATNYTPPDLSGYATTTYVADYVEDRLAQGIVLEEQTTRLATPNGLIWQDATGTVWQVEAIVGWIGTIWTNGQAYAAASTGVTQEVVFWPAETNYTGVATFTNAAFGSIKLEVGTGEDTWVWTSPGGNVMPNGAGVGRTNVFELAAVDVEPGWWVSLDLALAPVAASTGAVDRVLYASSGGGGPYLSATGGTIIAKHSTPDAGLEVRMPGIPMLGSPPRATRMRADGFGVSNLAEDWLWLDSLGFRFERGGDDVRFNLPIGTTGGTLARLEDIDLTDATNYTDAVAQEFLIGERIAGYALVADETAAINGDEGLMYQSDLIQAMTNAANAVADAKISTNNAAFVSAVLAVPLTGADAGDIAEIAEYGSYGTVGAALLALIAGLAALKRRVGAAETALSGKANSSDLPYALVTPGEWTFSGVGSWFSVTSIIYDSGSGNWLLSVVGDGWGTDTESSGAATDTSVEFHVSEPDEPYRSATVIATKTGIHLLDRAVNSVSVSAATTLTLPAIVNAGHARDFLVRLAISGSTVPTITFAAPTGETITYETDGDEFPVPDEAGTWLYSFTETAAHKFAVSLKKVNTVTQGGS